MAKRQWKDTTVEALKEAGTHWDPGFANFGVRVSGHTGRKVYVVGLRINGGHYSKRALGRTSVLALADAREKARTWIKLAEKGVDPAHEAEKDRKAKLRDAASAFAAVAEEFIEHIKANKERKAAVVERDIRNVLIPAWGDRPIKEIDAHDIEDVIKPIVKRGKRARAHNIFGHARRLFRWAIPLKLTHSPCANLSPKNLIGRRTPRDVILTDDGLRVLWRSVTRMPYPYGPLYRLLTLSALRLGDVCEAAWPEFHPELVKLLKGRKQDDPRPDWSKLNPDWRNWTIPAARMKKTGGEAKPHVVPLTDAMLDILWDLPQFKHGQFLFSNEFGKAPLKANHFSKPKARLDSRMLRTLKAMARKNGDDPKQVTLKSIIETSQRRNNWENHDVRRTARTHLSALKVAEEVREAVLAHARPGIKGTYDRWQYLDEKREALTLWGARLRSIVEPAPSNVIAMARA